MADIFISYSRQDLEFAERLYRELQRFNVRGFMDTTDVSAGAEFSRQLKESIKNADALLVILSSSASRSSWVMAEIGLAETLGKPVIPVLAPGGTYEDSVPPQLVDELVIDANSLPTDQVAAKAVSAITGTSVEVALQEVQSRVQKRQRILLGVSLALALFGVMSAFAAFVAVQQKNMAIFAANEAEKARLEAELRQERIDKLTAGDASMSIAPDGKSLATASSNGSIRIWNIATGITIALLEGHRDKISNLAFSPDAQLLASASWDGTVRIWDVAEGRILISLGEQGVSVSSVQFSPDGQILFTRSLNGIIRQWDLKSGRLLQVIEAPN